MLAGREKPVASSTFRVTPVSVPLENRCAASLHRGALLPSGATAAFALNRIAVEQDTEATVTFTLPRDACATLT